MGIERPLLEQLIKLFCDDFYNKQSLPFIAKNSIPIVWFGNLEQYSKSKAKVLTISINPSCIEFPRWGKQRFKDLTVIRNAILRKEYPVDIMVRNYNDYFKFNPYMQWFNFYERRLNEMDCSYFDTKSTNTAIHIDMHSAIATDPTWSRLSDFEREKIKNHNLFKSLLQMLNPDIALISVALPEFESGIQPGLPLKEWENPNHNCGRILLYRKHGIKFLHGRNMNGQPFGACKITEEIKRSIFD